MTTTPVSLQEQLEWYSEAAAQRCEAARAGCINGFADFVTTFSLAAPETLFSSDPAVRLRPLVELNVVARTSELLRYMLDAYQHVKAAAGGAAAGGRHQLAAATLVAAVLRVLDAAQRTSTAGVGAMGLRTKLLEQLADDGVVRVMARLPGFVQQELWPLVRAPHPAPHSEPTLPLTQPRLSSGRCSFRMGEDVAGCGLLGSTAMYVSFVLDAIEGVGAGGGARVRSTGQRFLQSVADSGVLASVSAALLVAPPWPPVVPGAPNVGDYVTALAMAQRNAVGAVRNVVGAMALVGAVAAAAIVAAPDVRALQRELLEQVAMVGGGAGASSAGRGSSERQQWPLLQHRALQLIWGEEQPLALSLYMCISAAAEAPFFLERLVGVAAAAGAVEGLFPSRAAAAELAGRVFASLRAHAEQLGPDGVRGVAGAEVQPRDLVVHAELLLQLVLFRIRGASAEEVPACLPDVLSMLGWFIALIATPLGLAWATVLAVAQALSLLATCTLSMAFSIPSVRPIKHFETCLPDTPVLNWTKLPASTRAACLKRLQPTGLPRSMDTLLRWAASRGGRLKETPGMGVLLHWAVAELLGPLLRARLMQLALAPSAGEGSAAGSSGFRRAREELGLVLTALKLLRLESGRMEAAPAGVPELLRVEAPCFSLALFVVQLSCNDKGLVALRAELLDPAMMAQMVAACGAAALPVLTRLLEEAAAWLRGEAAAGRGDATRVSTATHVPLGGSGSTGAAEWDPFQATTRSWVAAGAVTSIIKHLPPDLLLTVEPQRALVALGCLMRSLQRHEQQQPRGLDVQLERMAVLTRSGAAQAVVESVLLLSADGLLAEGCVPGWVWGKPPGTPTGPGRGRPGVGAPSPGVLDLEALSGVRGPSYAPQQGPILTIESSAAAVGFPTWRWEEAGEHRAEVVALARARAQELGLLEGRAWQVAAAVYSAEAVWPPRLLRLCGNPRCCNFGEACDAGLKSLKCGRCGSVAYCDVHCQKAHWAQHKGECGGLRE